MPHVKRMRITCVILHCKVDLPTCILKLTYVATRNKCIATSNKCLTTSNKKLVETIRGILVCLSLSVATADLIRTAWRHHGPQSKSHPVSWSWSCSWQTHQQCRSCETLQFQSQEASYYKYLQVRYVCVCVTSNIHRRKIPNAMPAMPSAFFVPDGVIISTRKGLQLPMHKDPAWSWNSCKQSQSNGYISKRRLDSARGKQHT